MRAQPVLKWAGGKTQILDHLLATAPQRIGTYYEPFVGGGALFFALAAAGRIERAVLSDLNSDLLNLYRTIRTRPEPLAKRLATIERQYISQGDEGRRSYFYAVRAEKTRGAVAAAARLIFLNRTCYNGLYRVNRSGQFNVPYGRYRNPKICDPPALKAAAEQLQVADIRGPVDFSEVQVWAKPGDFVYFDPPYQPMTKTASFTAYTSADFTWEDQVRLKEVFDGLVGSGVSVALSNSGHAEVVDLFHGYDVTKVAARRAINSRADGRGPVEGDPRAWQALTPRLSRRRRRGPRPSEPGGGTRLPYCP